MHYLVLNYIQCPIQTELLTPCRQRTLTAAICVRIMNMKQRFLLFVSTLVLSIVFGNSALAYDVEVDGIYYNLISKGNIAEVTKGDKKYSGDITIPYSIKVNDLEYTVKKINEDAFKGCRDLTSVTIPNSVTSIGDYTFYNCN